ncbi:MAG TPA: 3'-5' exonuclease [Terriglobales bacterium]|nr:3'-5' exonuclease [Terriglobales bacterium]
MAQMFPDSIEALPEGGPPPTEGERQVFGVLRDGLRPDSDYLCFFETALGGAGVRRWPDFIVFAPRLGIFVIEVKDWRADQMVRFDRRRVQFHNGAREWERANPERQAKSYADRLRAELNRNQIKPTHRGSGLPVGSLVALPAIDRATYLRRRFDAVLPSAAVLLADDLDPSSDTFIGNDAAGFAERLRALTPFAPPPLTAADVAAVRDVLWPRAVTIPPRAADGRATLTREVKYLDQYQARAARQIQPGHQLVKGPPGSGKTLILVHRCKYLALHQPRPKRILLLSYNLALTSFLKRLVQEQDIPLRDGGVQVHHFFELCARLTGEKIEYDYKPADRAFEYYQYVLEETEQAVAAGRAKLKPFDAVLVDEGQDFDDRQLALVRRLVRDGGDLVIALDAKQDLYNPGRNLAGTWKSLGIEIAGRVTSLKRVYRSTRALRDFSARFASKNPQDDGLPDAQAELPFANQAGLQGHPPELITCRSESQLLEWLVRDVGTNLAPERYRRPEVAILYDDKEYRALAPSGFRYGDRSLGQNLRETLEGAGIPVQWVSEDVHAKRLFDITRDSVVVSSVHSAKGLDFDLVYLLHPGWPDAPRKEIRRRIEPTYVAITRAKYRLVVLHRHEDQIIKRMIESGIVRSPLLSKERVRGR